MAKVTHVVVDTRDGMTFNRGSDGELFDLETATAFADHRNEGCLERFDGDKPYGVFRLTPADAPEMPDVVMVLPEGFPPELAMALIMGPPDDTDNAALDAMMAAAGAAMG